MVNVLLESYDLTADYLCQTLHRYIKPGSKVAILAFSFLDSQARCDEDWQGLYGKESGMFYHWLVDPFAEFGIREENIRFVNYFTDTKQSAAQALEQADILYFTGGLPDRMMERIDEFALREVLLRHDGIVLGCSAGAVIQLEEYHLSPDRDYPAFGYYPGLPWLKDFYVEVHYEASDVQHQAIRRVLQERGKTVYATAQNVGAIVVDEAGIQLLGNVKVFQPGDTLV